MELIESELQFCLRSVQAGPLFGRLLLLPAQLLSRSFQPSPERRQHDLLTFERRASLCHVGTGRVQFGLALRQLLRFTTSLLFPVLDFADLVLQVLRGFVKLLEALTDFLLPLIDLLPAILERGLQTVQANEIRLVLRLVVLKQLSFDG